ncbi:MAG: hypothetical protein C5B48_09660 [Candidatus Rokuibacteriota bacterium]|nr:MAG: hypothetical protein C5B48_09660 [Candidatus Rokubacteria bacterium]
MRMIGWIIGAATLVALGPMGAAEARVVTIQTSAPLADRSDRAIDQALKQAVDACVERATAMGLSSISLHDAAVQADRLVVQMVATDDDTDRDDEVQVLDLAPPSALERPK